MELISFYVPYNFKKGHPKFAGLELLLENFKKQAIALETYVKEETNRIDEEIKVSHQALRDSVEWHYSIAEKLPSLMDQDDHRIFAIELHPYINGALVTDTDILELINNSKPCKKSAWFSVINNVMIVHATQSYWNFESVKNGRVLTDEEVAGIMYGPMPESLKQL